MVKLCLQDILKIYPGGIIVPKKFMHLATAKEKNSGTFSEPKASMSYGEKITCIKASREKKFLVRERVKRNRACAKSPTTPVKSQMVQP